MSLTRLYLLRACYLLMLVGLGVQVFPRLLGETAGYELYEGVVDVMLAALAVLSIIGLIAPVKMLPLLLFEITWKVIWVLSVFIPRWRADALNEAMIENMIAVGLVLPFILIFPWLRFFAQTFKSMDRWR